MATTTNITIPRASQMTLSFSRTPPGFLPGPTIHFTVARAQNSLVKIIGPKACTAPDSDGAYTCVLSATDTDVAPGKYFWDTRVVDEGSETLLGSGLCVITGIAELPQ